MSTPTKVEKFKTLEADFGTTIAEGLWKKAIQTMNYIEKSYPIGMLLMFHATQSNLPHTPDSKYWKELDGTTVSNANSPLNGVALPDLRDKFFRHPVTGETVIGSGGSNTANLSHNHGGATTAVSGRGGFDLDNGEERAEISSHAHSISSSLSSSTSVLPPYIALKLYIRIV